jgi:O-antigen/teichoic acid export membrane protein
MKSSLKNLSVVGISNFLNLGLGLILFSAAAKTLNLNDFGVYSLLTILLVWFSKLIDFGSNSDFVSGFLSKNKNYLNELINFKLISFILSSILGSLTVYFAVNYYYTFRNTQINLDLSIVIPLFILGLFFYGINYLLFALYQKEERFVKASLLNFIPAIIKGSFGILIILGIISLDLNYFFGIFALSMIGSSLFLLEKVSDLKNFKFDLKIIHFLKNFFLAGTSQQINESWGPISNSLAFILKNLSDLGNYSFASKLSNVFSVISYSIYTVILTSNAKRKRDSLSYNLKESLILGIFLICIALVGTLLAPIIIPIIFGDKFSGSIAIFSVLIFSGALSSIHKFLDNYFFVEEKSKTLLSFTLLKLVLFFTLSYLFINEYGIIGLAIADLTVSLLTTVLTFTYIYFNLKRN